MIQCLPINAPHSLDHMLGTELGMKHYQSQWRQGFCQVYREKHRHFLHRIRTWEDVTLGLLAASWQHIMPKGKSCGLYLLFFLATQNL